MTDSKLALAYDQIRSLIVSLELPPGSVVDERDLNQRLGCGLTPIRQSLHRLSYERMVDILPRRATLVSKLGITEARQVLEARQILEAGTAALASQSITPEEAHGLHAINQSLRQSYLDNDIPRWHEIHRSLHLEIARCTHNPILIDSIEHVLTLGAWLWNVYLGANYLPRLDEGSHDEIVDAIVSRDEAAATEAMRVHFRNLKHELLSFE